MRRHVNLTKTDCGNPESVLDAIQKNEKTDFNISQTKLKNFANNQDVQYSQQVSKHKNLEKEQTTMANFLKNAFHDMKESAKRQHEIDKANFQATKMESSIAVGKAKRKAEQERQLEAALARKKAAQEQYDAAKGEK